MQINIGKSVWLVPQESGQLAWSDEISGTRVFLAMRKLSKLLKVIFEKILALLVHTKL